MKLLIKIALLLLPAVVDAQNGQKELDSLHIALKNAADDTVRMGIYTELGIFFEQINRDSSLLYLGEGLPIAQKLRLKLYEANILHETGYVLTELGDYPRALESLLQALKIAQEPTNEKMPVNLLDGLTPANFRLQRLGFVYLDLGTLYNATGNTNRAIPNCFQTIRLAASIKDNYLSGLSNMFLGEEFGSLNKLDSALVFEQNALRFFKDDFWGEFWDGRIYNYIGKIYQKKGNTNLSREALFKAISISKVQNNLSALGDSYIALARIYQSLKKTDSSVLFAKKSLEIYNSLNAPHSIADAYSLLSSLYYQKNKADSSLAWLKLAAALNDSLHEEKTKKLNEFLNIGFDEQIRLKELAEEKIETQTKIRTYTMLAGIVVFMLIAFVLFKNSRNRKKANVLLQKQKEEIELQKRNVEQTLVELRTAQAQLVQSEKMASLGELTAGIAHEIQNPLNFVNNFSEVSIELLAELTEEEAKGNKEDVMVIAGDLTRNLEKINHHGKRADAIVKGMLQHSRTNTGQKEPADINALADEYLRLSYYGLHAKDKSFNAEMHTNFDYGIGKTRIVPQDIGRVLLNLYNNAFYAVHEKSKVMGIGYRPAVTVSTTEENGKVLITVADNGNGIPERIKDKIFQPFFTTKPTGQGTGLGLSLSYDIVKAHGGELRLETKEGEGTSFIIKLPQEKNKPEK